MPSERYEQLEAAQLLSVRFAEEKALKFFRDEIESLEREKSDLLSEKALLQRALDQRGMDAVGKQELSKSVLRAQEESAAQADFERQMAALQATYAERAAAMQQLAADLRRSAAAAAVTGAGDRAAAEQESY